jgi:hypothetical protein
MELEQDDKSPEPVPLPPSKSPSPPPRAKSPVASFEKDALELEEEQPEIRATPPEDDDATGRWRDEVTQASNPESAEQVGLKLDSMSGLVLTRCRSIFRSSNSLP